MSVSIFEKVYALVDNVRTMLTDLAEGSDTYVFSSSVVRQLGRLSRGLTAEDIQGIPLDNDLLSIIEILSEYEDDLDSSQVSILKDIFMLIITAMCFSFF
jgi:uncharacterized protein Yka (UPF0111/DUF47 family)